MVHPLTDHDPLVQEIVRASGNKVPIFVEGEPHRGEESEFGRWCKNLPVTFLGRDGKETLKKDLDFIGERIDSVFAIVDRDLALPEEINATLDNQYDEGIYYLPRYDVECYYIDPIPAWHCIKQTHFTELDNIDPEWKEVEGIKSQLSRIAEEAVPQTAGNIVLRLSKQERFKDFNRIAPFLSEEEVIDQLKLYFPSRQDWVKEKFLESLKYVKSFFPNDFFKIISGKKFLVNAFFNKLPVKIGRETFFNLAKYCLNENPPQDFLDLIEKTILPRAGRQGRN